MAAKGPHIAVPGSVPAVIDLEEAELRCSLAEELKGANAEGHGVPK